MWAHCVVCVCVDQQVFVSSCAWFFIRLIVPQCTWISFVQIEENYESMGKCEKTKREEMRRLKNKNGTKWRGTRRRQRRWNERERKKNVKRRKADTLFLLLFHVVPLVRYLSTVCFICASLYVFFSYSISFRCCFVVWLCRRMKKNRRNSFAKFTVIATDGLSFMPADRLLSHARHTYTRTYVFAGAEKRSPSTKKRKKKERFEIGWKSLCVPVRDWHTYDWNAKEFMNS